jgi:hypothetical protein
MTDLITPHFHTVRNNRSYKDRLYKCFLIAIMLGNIFIVSVN